jgi:hypothetical protein
LDFEDHHNCLENQWDYSHNEIIKPKSMLDIDYLSDMHYLYDSIPFLQALAKEGETVKETIPFWFNYRNVFLYHTLWGVEYRNFS